MFYRNRTFGCFVGLLLLLAAVLKGSQLLTAPTAETGLLTSRWFLMGVVEYEFALSVLLLLGLFPGFTWLASLATFCLFLVVAGAKLVAGEPSCGCFGGLEIPPAVILCVDLIVVGLLLWARPARGSASSSVGEGRRWRSLRVKVACSLLLLVGLPAAYGMATFQPASLTHEGLLTLDSNIVVLEPEKWVGMSFPLAKYLKGGGALMRGHWRAVLYHHDCPKCREYVAALRSSKPSRNPSEEGVQRVAIIEIPPFGTRDVLPHDIAYSRLLDSRTWFVQTPTELLLEDGRVVAVTAASQLRTTTQ
ncbi:MAG: hypothetical protein R6U98_34665 [Pirellulaceae bacterium]